MGRPHIEFIHSWEAPSTPVTDGPFGGTNQRILSEDDETGARTSLVELTQGWSGDLGRSERRIELLTLRGACQLGDARFGEGCYADLPARADDSLLVAVADALLLVMVEDPGGTVGGPTVVIDTHELRLELPGPDIPPGLAIKRLRVDERRGDWTWIGAGAPGYLEDRAEIHPTVEEAFVLRGDVLVGERGEMGPGDYFWRPPNVRHGPIYCRSGRLIFFRTKGGGLSTTYEEVPDWRDIVDRYRSQESLYQGP